VTHSCTIRTELEELRRSGLTRYHFLKKLPHEQNNVQTNTDSVQCMSIAYSKVLTKKSSRWLKPGKLRVKPSYEVMT